MINIKIIHFDKNHKANIALSATTVTAGKIFPIYPGPIYCDENGGKLGYETAEDGNHPL